MGGQVAGQNGFRWVLLLLACGDVATLAINAKGALPHHHSPGFIKLMQNLDFKEEDLPEENGEEQEGAELIEAPISRQTEVDRLAEHQIILEEEYDRKRAGKKETEHGRMMRREAESPDSNDIDDDDDELARERRHSRLRRKPLREDDELDEYPQEEEELSAEDDEGDRRSTRYRSAPLEAESELEMSGEGSDYEDYERRDTRKHKRRSRRSSDEASNEESDEDSKETGNEDDGAASSGSAHTQRKVTTTRGPRDFIPGDVVRALYAGTMAMADAIVDYANNDGTIKVRWTNGNADHLTVLAGDVFRPQNPDPDDAIRLDGPNPYNANQDKGSMASAIPVAPSKLPISKAEIYDGNTLFPAHMLLDNQWSRPNRRPDNPEQVHLRDTGIMHPVGMRHEKRDD